MPTGYWSSIAHCGDINHTHLDLNKTALDMLAPHEVEALGAALVSLNHSTAGTCIKPHFVSYWHVFVCLYAVIGLAGAFGNIYMIAIMFLETSFRRCINFLLFNLCLSNLVKSLVVLPVSLYVLLTAHWRLGSFMCYASPLIQTFPVVVTMMTYLLASIDRYLMLFRPSSSNRPPSRRMFVFMIVATWVAGFCMVLPLKTCVRYYDMKLYFGDSLAGYGLCAIGFDTRIKEINTALFMVIYAIPLVLMVYLMLKSNAELKTRLKSDTQALSDAAASVQQHQPLKRQCSSRSYSRYVQERSVGENDQFLMPVPVRSTSPIPPSESKSRTRPDRTHSFLTYVDQEISQLSLLLRVNHCLCTMLALFAACWAPLQCAMLVCYVIAETPETVPTVDTLFLVCTLIGLSSTVTNPALLIYQRKSLQVVLHTGLRALRRLSSSAIGGFGGRSPESHQMRDETSEDLKNMGL